MKRNKTMKKSTMLIMVVVAGIAVLSSGCSDGAGQGVTSLTNEIAVLSRKLERCNEAINAQNVQIETLRNALSNTLVAAKAQLGNVETAVGNLKVEIDRNLLVQRRELERLTGGVSSNNLSITDMQQKCADALQRIKHVEDDTKALCDRFEIIRYRW